MNTSRKMNTSRSKRKKAIPLYFQKHHSSLTDILQTASYKRRIKELLKNNKSLALTIQDAKYTIADQLKEIEGYARTSNQVSCAQLKLRDMASTIQKLVCDLQKVQEYLDVDKKSNFDSMDRRIKIQVPDHSTIEESASRSTLEVDLALKEERSPFKSQEVSTNPPDSLHKSHSPITVEFVRSPSNRDDSVTEIYDHNSTLMGVGSVVKGFMKPQEDNSRKNQIMDNSVSIPIQSHPKPLLETSKNKLPGRLEAFLQNYKESPRKPLQALNSGSLVKNTCNAFISKIPKAFKPQAPQQQNENVKSVESPGGIAHRRETFVIEPYGIPDIFTSTADRRATFVISNSSEINKLQNDRRGTYVVPPESVEPIQEEKVPTNNFADPVPINNFAESVPSVENEIPNKTILLCEDMELTEVIPTRKLWTDETLETAQPIPCEKKMENILPKTSEDVEFTEIISKLPLVNSRFQDTIITEDCAVLEENISAKQNVASTKSLLEDNCFVKPCTSKSSNTPLPVLSNKVSPQQKTYDSEDDKRSQKSAVKRKKSHDMEPPERPKKGRASSTSKRKSVTLKGNVAVSDVNSKGAHRKSVARASSRKSVLPKDPEIDFCTDLEDELLSDINISSSLSPYEKKTRDKKSVNYEKFFADTSFDSVAEQEKDVQVGRRVIDFFETRQSLLPNKRNFVFTSKKGNAESTSTAPASDTNVKGLESAKKEENNCVFEFTASDSEGPNRMSKIAKKRSKKVDSTSQCLKESKKPHLEKVSHQQTEKPPEIHAELKSKSASKKSESVSCFKKISLTSASSDTADDSFVIGVKVDEINKMQELVNSKGERIILESSKPSRKTQLRKLSTGDLNKARSLLSEFTQTVESNNCQDVLVSSPSKLTIPTIIQEDKKSPNIDSPVTSLEDSGKSSCEGQSSRSSKVTEGRSSRSSKASEGLSSRSSKVSGGRGKVKRPFSGVSERRSKKKSTLDPSDFLDEFNSPITLKEAFPEALQLNSKALTLDCDMTEVYNLKDVIQAKVLEDKSKHQEQASGEKQTQQQSKVQEDKFKEQNQVSDEKLTQKQVKVQEDKSKQVKVQEDKSKHQEQVHSKRLIQQKTKVQEEKSKNKQEISGEKQIQQKAKVREDKFKKQEDKASIAKSDTLKIEKSKYASSEIGITVSALSKSKETIKEYNKEKYSSVEENISEDPSTKSIGLNTEALTLPSSLDNNKRTLTNHELVSEVLKAKQGEPSVSKVVKNVSPKTDVLCSTDVVAPSLQSDKPVKDSNTDQVTTVPAKNSKVTQNVKSKSRSNNEEPSVPCSSTDKNNAAVQDTAAKFNRADFKAMNLDDLTNNDFVPLKSKKLFKESQIKVDGAPLKEKQPKSKAKKPRTEKSNAKENKAVKIKETIEADLNSRTSKGEQIFDEVLTQATSSDSIPIHRQNCSGSIGSLCNADSKENEGRPSRRNRTTKCYKEPKLNNKMRR